MSIVRTIVVYILYAAVIIGLSVAIILSFSNKVSAPKSTKPSSQSQHHQASPNISTQPTTPKPSSTPSPNLANTGPGDTITIFIVISLGAALIHWLVVNHKLYLNKDKVM